MKLSIVIATYNRSAVLKQLLDELKNQTDKDFEVVVAIDGSSDDTERVLAEYKKSSPFELSWVNTGLVNEYGLSVARNMGIRASSGEVIVILDDDSFPVPEFVAEHKKSVRPRTLTGGARISDDPNDNLEEKNRLYLETYGDTTAKKFTPIPKYKWVVENNTCMFKEDWLASGLFDESTRAYGLIGQDFNKRLIKLNYQYQFNPRAAIIHHTEFKQHHLYKKIKQNKTSQNLRNFFNTHFPTFFNFLKKIKRLIEYR